MQLKYQAVLMELQNKILSGIWPENIMIPAELELCSQYKVSRITIRRALDELVQSGLIRRSRGKGTFVCQVKQYNEYYNGLISQDGVETNNEILNQILSDTEYSKESELVQTMLPQFKVPLDSGETITRLHLVRYVGNVPYAVMNIFLPTSLSKQINRSFLRNSSFLDTYEKSTNCSIKTIHRSFSAVIPDNETCALLATRLNTAHLWMKSIAMGEQDEPIAINYAVYDGNLFDFSVTIDAKNPPIGAM
ncbi:MAG: GntR family transcriptional regulator [Spirochaetia bacterium]|nr:GntR family transcriptional regulator [Spirochaetia bacterium]